MSIYSTSTGHRPGTTATGRPPAGRPGVPWGTLPPPVAPPGRPPPGQPPGPGRPSPVPAVGPINNHSKEDVMESLWFGMIFVTLCVVMVILAVVDNQG